MLCVHVCLSVLQGFCSVLLALEKLGLLNDSQFQRLKPGAADLRWVKRLDTIQCILYMYKYVSRI